MKLVRYGRPGAERPGLIDPDGSLRDLSRVVADLTPAALTPASLRRLRGLNLTRLPTVRGRPRLGCPLAGIGKMVCIGLNYTDHALEVGLELPKEPLLFIKASSAICGPDDPIVRPRDAVKLDYEVELGAVIGRDARYVDETDALSAGTPAGVGHGRKPPKYLQPGDVVEMGITGLGTQRHRVVEFRRR